MSCFADQRGETQHLGGPPGSTPVGDLLPTLLHDRIHLPPIHRRALARGDRPVPIRYLPSLRARLITVARDQMKVQVACTFAEGNRIHPLATAEHLHQGRAARNGVAPSQRLLGAEVHRSSEMPAGIQQQPTRQRRRSRVMPQDPERVTSQLPSPDSLGIVMQRADSARR
jgi:hypothetical protein